MFHHRSHISALTPPVFHKGWWASVQYTWCPVPLLHVTCILVVGGVGLGGGGGGWGGVQPGHGQKRLSMLRQEAVFVWPHDSFSTSFWCLHQEPCLLSNIPKRLHVDCQVAFIPGFWFALCPAISSHGTTRHDRHRLPSLDIDISPGRRTSCVVSKPHTVQTTEVVMTQTVGLRAAYFLSVDLMCQWCCLVPQQ